MKSDAFLLARTVCLTVVVNKNNGLATVNDHRKRGTNAPTLNGEKPLRRISAEQTSEARLGNAARSLTTSKGEGKSLRPRHTGKTASSFTAI